VAVAVWTHDADMAMGISPIPLFAPWLPQFLEGLAQLFFNHQNVIFHEIASLNVYKFRFISKIKPKY
jgi:hypothetical protein